MEFEPVIGLEVHAQLSTESKIFCRCRARLQKGRSVSDEMTNVNTCPVCTGHPGALPVMNKKVIEYAVKAGLATNCLINFKSEFARKNYFYPDLPKGYQISQFDLPICRDGWIEIESENSGAIKIRLNRIHIEEDAGKSLHLSGFSLVNLNRAGIPLIEIVSEPDITCAEDAATYLRSLHAIVTSLGICDGNMQEGNFRCDANVSVKPVGSETLGTRTEIKNVNSFRFVEKAIQYEIARQIEVIKSGGEIVQETRTYDSAKNVTLSMRSKEEAHDYRYFPDPDLVPLVIEESWVKKIGDHLPELPADKKRRYMQDFGLNAHDAGLLTHHQEYADFYEQSIQATEHTVEQKDLARAAKTACSLMITEFTRILNESNSQMSHSKLRPENFAGLIALMVQDKISSGNAKVAVNEVWSTGENILEAVERLGLRQVNDTSAIEPIVDEILKNSPSQVEQFKAGKEKLMAFFVGQAMKATKGQANPSMVQDLVKKKLND